MVVDIVGNGPLKCALVHLAFHHFGCVNDPVVSMIYGLSPTFPSLVVFCGELMMRIGLNRGHHDNASPCYAGSPVSLFYLALFGCFRMLFLWINRPVQAPFSSREKRCPFGYGCAWTSPRSRTCW